MDQGRLFRPDSVLSELVLGHRLLGFGSAAGCGGMHGDQPNNIRFHIMFEHAGQKLLYWLFDYAERGDLA